MKAWHGVLIHVEWRISPKTCRIHVQEVRTQDSHFSIRSSIVETQVFANWAFGLGLEELVQLSLMLPLQFCKFMAHIRVAGVKFG